MGMKFFGEACSITIPARHGLATCRAVVSAIARSQGTKAEGLAKAEARQGPQGGRPLRPRKRGSAPRVPTASASSRGRGKAPLHGCHKSAYLLRLIGKGTEVLR